MKLSVKPAAHLRVEWLPMIAWNTVPNFRGMRNVLAQRLKFAGKPDVPRAVSTVVRAKIERLYAADFERFGYQTASPAL